MTPDPIRQRYELIARHLANASGGCGPVPKSAGVGLGRYWSGVAGDGLSRGVVAAGCRELIQPEQAARGARVRRPGGSQTARRAGSEP